MRSFFLPAPCLPMDPDLLLCPFGMAQVPNSGSVPRAFPRPEHLPVTPSPKSKIKTSFHSDTSLFSKFLLL